MRERKKSDRVNGKFLNWLGLLKRMGEESPTRMYELHVKGKIIKGRTSFMRLDGVKIVFGAMSLEQKDAEVKNFSRQH